MSALESAFENALLLLPAYQFLTKHELRELAIYDVPAFRDACVKLLHKSVIPCSRSPKGHAGQSQVKAVLLAQLCDVVCC